MGVHKTMKTSYRPLRLHGGRTTRAIHRNGRPTTIHSGCSMGPHRKGHRGEGPQDSQHKTEMQLIQGVHSRFHKELNSFVWGLEGSKAAGEASEPTPERTDVNSVQSVVSVGAAEGLLGISWSADAHPSRLLVAILSVAHRHVQSVDIAAP